MSDTKEYGSGGRPMFIRMSGPERAAWDRAKADLEQRLGKRLSHSRFISTILARYMDPA